MKKRKNILAIVFALVIMTTVSTQAVVYAQTENVDESTSASADVNGRINEVKPVKGEIKLIINRDPDAPETELLTDRQKLIEIVMNDDERQAVRNGDDMTIWLEIKDAEDIFSDDDKQKFKDNSGDYTIGQYVDISLLKQLSTETTPTNLYEIASPIQIALTIPENLRNDGRTFALARLYDGKVEMLPITMDYDTFIITFETDRFSKYAILYKDTQKPKPTEPSSDDSSSKPDTKPNDDNSKSENKGNGIFGKPPLTGDNTPIGLYFGGIIGAVFIMIGNLATRKKRDK